MEGQGKLIAGVVVGAGAMYLLDPDRGARRRSLLRDRGVHVGHQLGDGLVATARDARNRTRGAAAELRARLRPDRAGDEVLHDRVRSASGRAVSHPGAVTVDVSGGLVILSGHVLADEVDTLLRRVARVRGVSEVRNELAIHRTAEGVSALQGPGRPPDGAGRRENWSPGMRLLMGTAGGLLVFQGSRSRGARGRALRLLGVGLLARAASNLPARRLVRLKAGRRAIPIEKTIVVAAPIEQVWELWSHFENFPRFMTHLREVRKIDEGHSHWVAEGPGGVPVEWDAVVTDWVPNQFIGWTSITGSPLETSGQVRFRSLSDRETGIDVQLSYNPPAGPAADAIATLVGADPGHAVEEDLVRLKSLLESGSAQPPGDSTQEQTASKGRPRRKKGSTSSKRPR